MMWIIKRSLEDDALKKRKQKEKKNVRIFTVSEPDHLQGQTQ